MKRRKVLIVTGSRGEYGYIRPVIRLIEKCDNFGYAVVATNMHLLPEFGYSVNEFERDKIEVKYKPYMAFGGSTNESMAKSLGVFMLSLTDIVAYERPDMILIAGDRGEQMVGAMVGAHLQLPTLHIQAGELSGNIDGMTRHAITKYAHVHFAANDDAKERLVRMGEEPFRVHMVGAPQLDELVSLPAMSKEELYGFYNLDAARPLVLVVQHPVTEQACDAADQMQITMRALCEVGHQCLIVYPNNDAGSAMIQRTIEARRDAQMRIERNIKRDRYANLMRYSAVIVGNSSSGILEAPTFELPAVNIGRRQDGRFQGQNVINVDHDLESIVGAIRKAMAPEFRNKLRGMPNPYGDGRSSERIVEVMRNLRVDNQLLMKKLTY